MTNYFYIYTCMCIFMFCCVKFGPLFQILEFLVEVALFLLMFVLDIFAHMGNY